MTPPVDPRRSFKHYRRCGAPLVSFAAAALAACVAIPIPHSNDVGQPVKVDPANGNALTREEVLARWGEPFAVVENERVVAYSWVHAGWIWCVAVYRIGGGCGTVKTTHLMLIQFDESGRLQRAEESSYDGTGMPLAQTVREWANKEAIKIGVTTREEIIARLGEPNTIWEQERVFAYTDFPGNQMQLVKFDEAGHVTRSERVERPSSMSNGEFVSGWATGEAHVGP